MVLWFKPAPQSGLGLDEPELVAFEHAEQSVLTLAKALLGT